MKCLKWIVAVTFSVLSLNTFATDITGETIMDNYIGAGYSGDVNGKIYKYDIDKMVVSRNGTTLNVDIFTAFYNNIGDYGIDLGDLFMAADESFNDGTSPWDPAGGQYSASDRYSDTNNNTGTNWNYVYDLGGERDTISGTGQLKSGFTTNDLKISSDLHGGARYNQAVRLADSNQTTHSSSNWSVDFYNNDGDAYGGRHDRKYGKVSFSFDVSGTALATANQIAFRWAMTCANDIIEGVASFAPTTNSTAVPEPQTIVLMLLAMVGLTYRRKVSQK